MDALIAWTFATLLVVPGSGELSLLVGLLAGLVVWVRRRRDASRDLSLHALWWPALALASVPLLKGFSWFWSVDPARTLGDVATHLHFVMWLPLVLLYRHARAPLDAMLLGVRVAAAVLLAWAAVHWMQHGLALNPLIRLEAGAQNPGVLGQLAGVMTLWLTLAYIRRPGWLGLGGGLALMSVVYAAGGRSHIVVTVAGVVVLLAGHLLLVVPKSRPRVYGLAALCALVLVTTLALWPSLLTAYAELKAYEHAVKVVPASPAREEATSAVGTSMGNRAGLYHVAHQAFTDSPWLGFGAGSASTVVQRYSPLSGHFVVTSHYHQQYIQVLMDTGLLGLALTVWALAGLTLWMWRHTRHARFLFACYLALAGHTAAVGLFTGALQQGLIHTFLIASLAVLGAQVVRDRERDPQIAPPHRG